MKSCIFLLLFLASAGSFAAGQRIDAGVLAEMRPGQTTFDEIVRRFGRPNFLSKNWDGTRTAAYAYSEGRSTAGLSLPALGAVIGGGSGSADSVVFYFDERGVLRDYRKREGPTEVAAEPAVRYVEPGAGGGTPAARPAEPARAEAGVAQPSQAAPAAAAPAGAKPEPQVRKPARDDGLPWWMPSKSARDERN